MSVVSNSRPLIALDYLGRVDLLEALYSEVGIPPAVAREVQPREMPPTVLLRSLAQPVEARILHAALGAGESEAIALAATRISCSEPHHGSRRTPAPCTVSLAPHVHRLHSRRSRPICVRTHLICFLIMGPKRKDPAAAALARKRWAKTSVTERKAVGQALAKARWVRANAESAA